MIHLLVLQSRSKGGLQSFLFCTVVQQLNIPPRRFYEDLEDFFSDLEMFIKNVGLYNEYDQA